MPTITQGRRKRAGKVQSIGYSGQASLLALVDEAQDSFFNLFEEAARMGWIDGTRFQSLDVELSHLAVKYDIPQSP